MNTKQMLITITVIALLVIGLGWYMSNSERTDMGLTDTSTSTEIVIPTPTTTAIALPEIAGTTLQIPDEDASAIITTETGTSSDDVLYSASFGEDETGFVAVVENQLTALSSTEFVVPFAVSAGGSGTFSYLGLLVDNDGQLEHRDSYFLGDRIRISKVSFADGVLMVETLDRHTDQAMSDEPSVSVLRELALDGDTLTLVNEYFNVAKNEISAEVLYDNDAETLRLTGVAPRNWFFEGDFPVRVESLDGELLYEGYVTALGTDDEGDRVPFVGEITEATKLVDEAWIVTFIKDNVSEDRSLDANYSLRLQ